MNRPPLGRAALTALLGFGCVAYTPGAPRDAEEPGAGAAIVIGGERFGPGRGSVLAVMQGHVYNMRVHRRGECPEIEIRGRKSLTLPTPPGIYVQGQRAANTCILDMLDPAEVSRVEVYPGGVTGRPGYSSQTGGLILVFLRDGRS